MKLVACDDGSFTAYNETYQQTYHSRFGAITESRKVYLQNSGVQERIESGKETHVLEIGFGLGLNFLVTASLANTNKAPLNYTGVENALISPSEFQSLNYQDIPEISETSADLHLHMQGTNRGINSRYTFKVGTHTHLNLIQADAVKTEFPKNYYHAIYLDAFSPDANSELWTEIFLTKLYNSLHPDGRLVSYCVNGNVRRNLSSAGFTILKKPGPKGKREVLTATRTVSN